MHANPMLITCFCAKDNLSCMIMHIFAKAMLPETRMSSLQQWISWGFVLAKPWLSKQYTNFFLFASLVAKKLTVACACIAIILLMQANSYMHACMCFSMHKKVRSTKCSLEFASTWCSSSKALLSYMFAFSYIYFIYVRIWYHACMVATSFRRPHRPRDENIRAIFKYAGLNLPGCLVDFAYLKQ